MLGTILLFSMISFYHSRAFANDLSCWRNGVATSPRSSIARNGLGKALYKRGEYWSAEVHMLKAIEYEPNNPIYLYNLGALYFTVGKLDNARELMLREISLYPNYPKANYVLAEIYNKQGDYNQAEEHYHREIGQNPGYIKSYIGLAQLHFKRGDLVNAMKTLKEAERLAPGHKDIRELLGKIEAQKDK
jgi:tetratricopeptide (TPR) repeat protein